jgi:acetyl-CoA carboxylase carboxyl transferase subunit alpha
MLRAKVVTSGSDIGDEIARVEDKASQALTDLYANLTPWQKTLVARHPQRPHFTDFVSALMTEFTPMAGDRKFAEDEALVGGFGRFRGEAICVVGQEKGATTDGRIKHNFGMARPEGYRKAVRLMEMADRFGIPVLSLVDSAGASIPGALVQFARMRRIELGPLDGFASRRISLRNCAIRRARRTVHGDVMGKLDRSI